MFADAAYLVGLNASKYTEALQRLDFQRLAGGPEMKALFCSVMYRLLACDEHRRLVMMVGLPVEIMEYRECAEKIQEKFHHRLIGLHEFGVNEETRVILGIEDLKVMT